MNKTFLVHKQSRNIRKKGTTCAVMNQEGNSSFNLFQTLDHSTPNKAELLIVMSREIQNLQPTHCKDFNPHFFL